MTKICKCDRTPKDHESHNGSGELLLLCAHHSQLHEQGHGFEVVNLPPIWDSGVDGNKFHVTVDPIGASKARLTVWVTEDKTVLLDAEVGLMYGALFGPDASDVTAWQEQALAAIDAHLKARVADTPGSG